MFQERKDYLHRVASRLDVPADDLLADVDLIRWCDLRHAYGSATDVPDCLRIVAYAGPDEREDAQCELQSNIFHQYTLYQATVFAVPFLIQMASSPSVPERAWLLDYLRSLAQATDHVDGPRPHDAPTIREAVSVGLAAFRTLADSDDQSLAAAARDLMAACTEVEIEEDWWRRSSWVRQSI